MGAGKEAEKLSRVVLGSLEEDASADELARRAFRSRAQFFRVFGAMIAETPAAMRRRLLLERAAWDLGRTRRPITDIAFDAHYGSLEAFTRAFCRAFKISPSVYRRMGATHYRLPAPNAIHFCTPASVGGGEKMDLFDIFAGGESFHVRKLLEHARELTDAQLDKPLDYATQVFPWDSPAKTLRDLLWRIVVTKEVWSAALAGSPAPDLTEPREQWTPAALLTRLEAADATFNGILSDVRNRNAWSDTFVDALCEPPETFTFVGMFAHVIAFNIHQRLVALDAMRRMGVKISGFGCPSEYEASVASSS